MPPVETKINLIVAACSNQGIGYKGGLPWSLKREYDYCVHMTTYTKDASKRNAVIMGRKTWESIETEDRHRRRRHRFNFVLSGQNLDLGEDSKACKILEEAIQLSQSLEFKTIVESIWILGGNTVYESAMKSPHCHRLYYTDILAEFECDKFFPPIDPSVFKLVTSDPEVRREEQLQNGVRYKFLIYEKQY